MKSSVTHSKMPDQPREDSLAAAPAYGFADPDSPTPILIIGVGRWLRRDDQAGLLVAESLLNADLPDAHVVLTESPMTDILGNLDGVERLILVDAARSDAAHPPGTWQHIDYVHERPRLGSRPSTDVHSLSVELALNLAHEMGRLPREVWVYAIAAGDYGHGENVTPQVRRAIREVALRIIAETSKRRKVEKSKHGATAATRTEPGRTAHRLETGATSAPVAEGKQHA